MPLLIRYGIITFNVGEPLRFRTASSTDDSSREDISKRSQKNKTELET